MDNVIVKKNEHVGSELFACFISRVKSCGRDCLLASSCRITILTVCESLMDENLVHIETS